MSFSTRIYLHKAELEEQGCKPNQIRMAPDVYQAVLAEQEGGTLEMLFGMKVKVSKNLKRGTVTIEETLKTLRKRLSKDFRRARKIEE